MEQVIFLHADEDSEETLGQIQRSLAQRLVLVAPAHMDRLRLSLLLRLARRCTTAQARDVCLVSEDRLAQMLAARMGFAVASTLDEYRGLTPSTARSPRKRRRRSSARLASPLAHLSAEARDASAPPRSDTPAPRTPGEQPEAQPERPGANLEKMLVDGYLPNPAATPDLEEEEERAEREEQERLREARLYYEIDDDEQPSRAEQEAERHEGQVIARILKTSQSEPPDPDNTASGPAENDPPGSPAHPSVPPPAAPRAPEDRAASAESFVKDRKGGLRPMRTIDDLLREQRRGEVFEWFEREAAVISGSAGDAAKTASATLTRTGPAAAAPAAAIPQTRAAASVAAQTPRPGNRWQQRQAGAALWRRVSIISALALSVLMTGIGLALIPSAEVSYQEEISPYSEALLLDARPAALQAGLHQPGASSGAPTPADIARFDGILTAQATATGRRAAPDAPDQLIAFPTQDDADQIGSRLQAQLQQWGEQAIHAQAAPDDILGPIVADQEVQAFPPVGTSLPAGVSRFQVSVALHLRATLIRHAALLQAARQQLGQDVRRARPGFAPQPGQMPQIDILSVAPAGPGEAQLELLVRVQAAAMIGPALTPDQVRSAIAGMAVPDAEAYLNHQPGMSAVSISVQPRWLNRLPIFSARIGITILPVR